MTKPAKSILKGALAGLAGGFAGAAAKAYLESLYALRMDEAHVWPGHEADALPGSGSARETGLLPNVAPALAPWVFGGLAGATYGAAVELEPTAASWQGAAFGLAVDRFTRADTIPMAGVGVASEAEATQAKISRRVTYAVFGIVTEIVRRGVRRGLA